MPNGIPSNAVSMSLSDAIETPTLPTSPSDCGESGSYPICVGKSNAMLRPVWPFSSINLKRSFVSFASPNPEY